MQTSGLVLDVYDDVGGEVLRTMFASSDEIPNFVKQAHVVTADERSRLPDDVFALVLLNGEEKLRKFACIDEGNTALSVLYFLKNAHKLPAEARQVAAENLKVACGWYGLDVPEELEKEAGLAGMALRSAAKNPVGAALTAMKVPSVAKGTSQNIKANLAKVRAGEAMGGAAGGLAAMSGGMEHLASAFGVKEAEVTGTSTMPLSAAATKPEATKATVRKTAGAADFLQDPAFQENVNQQIRKIRAAQGKAAVRALAGKGLGLVGKGLGIAAGAGLAYGGYRAAKRLIDGPQKTAHLRPVVDVTDKEATSTVTEKKASLYALGDKYPLDSYEQVKRASAYFDEYGKCFSPAERHEYCVNMVKRAQELGIPVSDEARKYGSEKYASAIELQFAIDARKALIDDADLRGLYDELVKSAALMPPEEYAVVLGELDKAAGVAAYYDRDVPDPFASTFGFDKTAEDEKKTFTDVIGNYYVTAADLERLKSNKPGLKSTFGDDFCEEFCKDPVGIYKSLPVDQKKLLIRMATENSPM